VGGGRLADRQGCWKWRNGLEVILLLGLVDPFRLKGLIYRGDHAHAEGLAGHHWSAVTTVTLVSGFVLLQSSLITTEGSFSPF
jgi:hypothetical protein